MLFRDDEGFRGDRLSKKDRSQACGGKTRGGVRVALSTRLPESPLRVLKQRDHEATWAIVPFKTNEVRIKIRGHGSRSCSYSRK